MGTAPDTRALQKGTEAPAGRQAGDGHRASVLASGSPSERGARPPPSDLAALAGLLFALAFLWGRGLPTWYWVDEGLSLGISSHPLGDMRALLAQDTSPPFYHLLLLGWMRLFGSSEAVTHTLSLLFALATVPAALWAGWTLFDRRTGWTAAGLAAASPFLAAYATETRMYSLVALLSVLATATFVNAFVRGRRRFLPGFAICTALLLYTHYWGIFFVLGAAAALVVCWAHVPDRRRLVVDAALALGAVALLFAPWVPTLLDQRAHSTIRWSVPPSLQLVRDDLVGFLGGPAAAAALALCAGAAVLAILRRPWTDAAVVIVVAVVIALVALGAGWVNSRASSQWHGRYLGVLVGPLVLAVAVALARTGELAIVAVVIVGVLSGPFVVGTARNAKSNVPALVEEASPLLRDGDVVVGVIGDFPLLAHYLPDGLRYAAPTGPVDDPRAANWRDAMERLERSDPVAVLSPVVEGLPLGGRILVTCPSAGKSDLAALPPFPQLEIGRCHQAANHLLGRPDLRLEREFVHPRNSGSPRQTHLLTKMPRPAPTG